jgi:hypothetical protein
LIRQEGRRAVSEDLTHGFLTPHVNHQVVKLREALVEEGRRLRYLMEEEVNIAKIELERLREDWVS